MRSAKLIVMGAWLLAPGGTAQAKSYKGAEVYTRDTALHGRIEVRMRMARGSGLVSTFFTYKEGSEMSGAMWEESDIEVLGKNDAKTWQSNLITGNPRMTSEMLYTASGSLADGYHTYAIEWTPDYVSWTFDGKMVRKTEGGQASKLTSAATFRFNAWASDSTGWVGTLDDSALPAYQFVNWIKYYRYDNGQFVLDWTDEFDSFDINRWSTGNWTFDGNLVDFDPANAVVKDGTLILALTKEGQTGFSGSVPTDDGNSGGGGSDASVVVAPSNPSGGCNVGGPVPASSSSDLRGLGAILLGLGIVLHRRPRAPRAVGPGRATPPGGNPWDR